MSSPIKKTPAKGEPAFSARELELLGKALQANKNDVAIDYPKFAELGGFKNANSAKASWHKLKEKFERARGPVVADGAADPKTSDEDEKAADVPRTPASGKKRKAAAVKGEEGEDTPNKSAKKGRKPAAKGKKTIAAAADEEVESKAEVKKESDDSNEEGEKSDDKEKGEEKAEAVKDESEEEA
ncbi:hypothetical protein M409DRAFT_29098 [Zasmidium cellare ATCC 36951]|uniref:Myb-like domain-containing protein n=1 Tax=Zasmidium cellare ATCC 36951 TaxID=1080233 RepID=A0A6A6C098_ZASCE|nr:uncharacterized protein M409DRAFT_29098 [Zasmidium cellare ATCC 36951]KAF2160477.1 hypothetical protein M409DRAFT_29098 [Zasmidium cellare ATCC 36951]